MGFSVIFGGVRNLGRHSPNLVSMPAYVATATRIPPMWSGFRDKSGFVGIKSDFELVVELGTKKNI